MDVITINTDCQEDYERKVRSFLEYGYELKSCSCGYYGISGVVDLINYQNTDLLACL